MKQFVVFLGVCCLLCATAATASAGITYGTTTVGNISVAATWDTTSYPGYIVVDIYVDALSGVASGSSINAIEGIWTAVGGTFRVKNKAASLTTFRSATTNSVIYYDGEENASSYSYSGINFDSYLDGSTWSRDGGDATYASTIIQGGWYTSSAASYLSASHGGAASSTTGYGYPANLLAELIVSTSTTAISFASTGADGVGGLSYLYGGGTTEVTCFKVANAVPEPSTLALLGCGLFGLLAYAWRKRK